MIDTIALPIRDGLEVRYVESVAPPAATRGTIPVVNHRLDDLARRVPYGVFGRTGGFIMSEQFTIQTIEKPRQNREGSVTNEQADAVYDAFVSGKVPKGEAVIVSRGITKENTARNRARSLATLVKERHGTEDGYIALSAHSIPDPAGTTETPLYIGAVSVKPPSKPKAATQPSTNSKPATK